MKVAEYFGYETDLGDKEIGLEVEVEGQLLPDVVKSWNTGNDGSLRGNNREYTLRTPCTRSVYEKRLVELYDTIAAVGPISNSKRCGVHVHLNARPLTIEETFNIVILYLIFEPLLMRWCGASREGNLFCMRAQDAEYLIYTLIKDKLTGGFTETLDMENFKYASINIAALSKYGSLEFRGLGTPLKVDPIILWVRFLLDIKDFAVKAESSSDFFFRFSRDGGDALIDAVFGERGSEFKERGYERLLNQAVRRIQTLAYAPLGEVKKKEFLRKEPQPRLERPQAPGANAVLTNAVGTNRIEPVQPFRWENFVAEPAQLPNAEPQFDDNAILAQLEEDF